MRAVSVPQFGPADVLVYGDWPDPPEPGPGQVAVAVEASGLNPADVKIRAGLIPLPPEVSFPYVAGREAAGTVLAVGDGVSDLAPGDLVFGFFRWDAEPGGHAERLVVAADVLAHRPAHVPVAEAAGVPLAGLTAFQGLRALAPAPGATVLVLGAAVGVGSYATQLAALAGLRVIGTASPGNHDYLQSLGAVAAVDYHRDDAADAISEIDGPVTYVVDAVGSGTLDAVSAAVAPGAAVAAVMGPPSERRDDLVVHMVRAEPGRADLGELAAHLDRGALRTHVQEVFPFARSADAHRLVETGHVRGKVVLQPA